MPLMSWASNHRRRKGFHNPQVIGHARGIYAFASRDTELLVMFLDFSFTTGKFNGSSFGVFSQNPVTETYRELAVVGGRGKFRMARGFAKLKTCDLNFTAECSFIEYKVTEDKLGFLGVRNGWMLLKNQITYL